VRHPEEKILRILLITPPLVDHHSPYPATAYLTGFLKTRRVDADQKDASIDLVHKIFSQNGLRQIRVALRERFPIMEEAPGPVRQYLEQFESYERCVEPAIRFLRGENIGFASRIATRRFFPESPRLREVWAYEAMIAKRSMSALTASDDPLDAVFGRLGITDRARYLASVFLEDIATVIRMGLDELFSLSQYGGSLASDAPDFGAIESRLESSNTLIEKFIDDLAADYLERGDPSVVGLTAPFPGNVYGAFRIARAIKKRAPGLPIVFGGGYVNTQLRQLSDPRVFNYVDYVTLDDGEDPLLGILEHIRGNTSVEQLVRTFVRREGRVVFHSDPSLTHTPPAEVGTPTYRGLDVKKYLSISDVLCPIPRTTALGVWNKLTLAHGCYWKRCAFCDTSLDYIGRYKPAPAKILLDRIKSMIAETGSTCFHFVDEAAPPATLRALGELLIEEKLSISWWSMVRFDRTFTPELAKLLARSGCVAVEGGLEVASERLLQLMDKGVTLDQVSSVTQAFADAGILVHAFLMYGFPSQTLQETVNALEFVRRLFKSGCLHSAVWSRFSLTAYSPAAANPDKFGIEILPLETGGFSHYSLQHTDSTRDYDIEAVGAALTTALNNYIHGTGFDVPVQEWFKSIRVPSPVIAKIPALRSKRGGLSYETNL
jgi:radical SAM superfamily enzyme YgiQ (UPF0313 family)